MNHTTIPPTNANAHTIQGGPTTTYIPRTIVADLTDIDVLTRAYTSKSNVLISGPTGSGKSSLVYAMTKSLGIADPIRFNLNGGTTPEDMLGSIMPNNDGGTINGWCYRQGALVTAVKEGRVLLLDEINAAQPSILFILNPLLEPNGRLRVPILAGNADEEITPHPNFFVVATMNPEHAGNYAGTKELNDALADRFPVHLEHDYSEAVEANIVPDEGLRQFVQKLRHLQRAQKISTPISTRTLVSFNKNLEVFGAEMAKMLFVNRFHPSDRQAITEAMYVANIGNEQVVQPEKKPKTKAAPSTAQVTKKKR